MDSSKGWFILLGQKVLGPFSTEQAEACAGLAGASGFWRRGMAEWALPSDWPKERERFRQAAKPGAQAYYLEHEPHIPRTLSEVVGLLRPSLPLGPAKLWSPSLNRLVSCYEVAEVRNGLGLPRRGKVRTGLSGTAAIDNGGAIILARAETISLGGLGASLSREAGLSGEVTVSLKCEGLGGLSPLRATVLYSRLGSVGLKFDRLGAEGLCRIGSYVRGREGAALAAG
jgi:hypothetical protein